MSRLTKFFSIPVPDLKNHEGYPAYQRPLEKQYLQTLLTNTLGNTFYADRNELLQEAIAIHNAMVQKDAGFVAKALPLNVTLGTPDRSKITDECRWAYKDSDQVIENERDLVKPLMKLKTVAVIKAN